VADPAATSWRTLLRVLALLATHAACFDAFAHKPSDSYLGLRAVDATIEGQWDIALRDLDHVLGLDDNQDGAITWGELRAHRSAVFAYAMARLRLEADGMVCPVNETELLVDRHSDGAYAVLRFSAPCDHMPGTLTVDYRLLFDVDPQHRGLLRLEHGGQTRSAIFATGNSAQRFELTERPGWRQFLDYLRHGVWHIGVGFDHVLFLLSLLLPAVLVRTGDGWQAAPRFAPAFWDVFKVVTAFTAAHSITLTAAALGVIHVPSRWVESAIAASVMLAAANNLRPVAVERRWIIAFVFGLVHGLGFASVLTDLGLPRESLLRALVAFNLGVELGQLAIVSAFLPIAWALRATPLYRRGLLIAGSVAIIALAGIWLAERAFDLRLWQ
jgi:hypothetical protein